MLTVTCYLDMQGKPAMIHPHTPIRVAIIQEPVMPSIDQDVEQQKPTLTGAGIGSSTAARNESQQFLMKLMDGSCPSRLLINLVFLQLI